VKSLSNAVLFGFLFSLSAGATAQTPTEIFQEMDARKRASFSGVDNFSVMKTTMGMCSLEYFEKATTTSEDGRGAVEYMRLVPISEVGRRRSPDSAMANASPEELDYAADQLEAQGPAMDQQVRNELQSAGLPGGLGYLLTNPPSDKPWLSPMPGDMMSNYALMLRGAAEGKRQEARQNAQAETEAKVDPLADVASRTRVVGRETYNNRPAIRLITEDVNQTQVTNGQEFTLKTLHLWVDEEKYVPLKMQIEGVARDGGETRDLKIVREDMAYRTVPGCGSMYEPGRSVMSIAGILNAEEEAQMLEAQAQLAEFETQMASMPPAQKDMIMRQMGPQMEMFKNMAAGNGIEVVSLVTGMRCNAGLPTEKEYMQTVPGVSASSCIGFGQSQGQGDSPATLSGFPPASPAQASPPTVSQAPPSQPPASSPQYEGAALEKAQQACLQEKMAAAQAAQKKKRGFGSLMKAVARTAGSMGNYDVSKTIGDVYNANATAEDLASAAKDLGLTEDEVAACQNPS
jgi:hypothetical protein